MDHSFATAWDDGVMLASRRTWWRIAAEIEDQMLRPTIPTRRENKQGRREKPVVKATGPGQAWSCYAEVVVMPIPVSAARVPAAPGAVLSA
ncbi:hypothetical protein [Paeniglutamicibacter psychrophenolicus]|uniref:Transposase n=1 Tax=Paeniglutamicibacter psychrophenolicus TaxID=257454 RepID=A0ABS4WAQ1_9MICC|nr:hypothetical protein [Paeniglutamicibacter psychrophenolicus]MBP2373287.1 hypothetical protein [Paeniglutamicibacter psychrophenolicus]